MASLFVRLTVTERHVSQSQQQSHQQQLNLRTTELEVVFNPTYIVSKSVKVVTIEEWMAPKLGESNLSPLWAARQ